MRRPRSTCASACRCSFSPVLPRSARYGRLHMHARERASWRQPRSSATRQRHSHCRTGYGSRRRRFARGTRRTERGMRVADHSASPVAQLDALTGSRFVAAYAILVLHGTAFGYTLPSWLNLSQAVSYFFVLSGFILGYRYPNLSGRRAVARFYWARFARIWAVHFFCLMLSIAFVPAAFWRSTDAAGWSILPLQLLLVNAWIPIERFEFGFNAPAWTISVEWFFYAVYPPLLWRWKATWHWKLSGSALLMVALALIAGATRVPAAASAGQENQISTLALLYGNPLARLFEFTLGMTFAMVWHRFHERMRFPTNTATALEFALLFAIVADLHWAGHQAPRWAAELG